jgi:hypothetical protein
MLPDKSSIGIDQRLFFAHMGTPCHDQLFFRQQAKSLSRECGIADNGDRLIELDIPGALNH